MAMLKPEDEMVTIPPDTTEGKGMNLLSSLLLPLAGPEEFDLEVCLLYPPILPCVINSLYRIWTNSLHLFSFSLIPRNAKQTHSSD
jgi:hypothetical protein